MAMRVPAPSSMSMYCHFSFWSMIMRIFSFTPGVWLSMAIFSALLWMVVFAGLCSCSLPFSNRCISMVKLPMKVFGVKGSVSGTSCMPPPFCCRMALMSIWAVAGVPSKRAAVAKKRRCVLFMGTVSGEFTALVSWMGSTLQCAWCSLQQGGRRYPEELLIHRTGLQLQHLHGHLFLGLVGVFHLQRHAQACARHHGTP